MTDRKVAEPTLAAQRMAERLMHNEMIPAQPITLIGINPNNKDQNVDGSLRDDWRVCLVLTQGLGADEANDVLVLDFPQTEMLYRLLDTFFNA